MSGSVEVHFYFLSKEQNYIFFVKVVWYKWKLENILMLKAVVLCTFLIYYCHFSKI